MTTIHDGDSGSAEPPRQQRTAADAAHEAIVRRRDELEAILALLRLGFCRLTRGGRMTHASAQFRAELGFAPDEPREWADFEARIHEQDRAALSSALRAALAGAADLDLSVRVRWPQGVLRWIELRGRLVPLEGGEPELLIVSRDVTAERLTSEVLVEELRRERSAREAAESANHAKDEFLSLVSHEMRSPLNAILGWNRILAVKRGDDPEVAAVTPRIEHSARAQLKMVNDLLDLGRIGTGKLRISPRPIRIATVISSALEAARPAALAKGVELHSHLPHAQLEVSADPDRLQQVVANLLSNAVKFTPQGGRVDVQLTAFDEEAEISVSDTGEGIAPELLPHVFDRFRQGNGGTRRTGGLGLGLTLAREIVTLHGGTISASSEGVGRGATFRVRLPLVKAARREPGGPLGHEDAGSLPTGYARKLDGLSILVVDDEMDARTVVAEALRLEGASVAVSDSARAAYDRLTAADAGFDILITDIGMPEEDGYSLVRKLRAMQNGERVVAVAVTGFASRRDVEAAMEAGFDLHVPKPVDFDSFVPIIRRLSDVR